ncbi:MAG: CidA/LrgA family protein [Afipia sp.]|nr:MAG: CidA/LrgA family protein [Afipia sp.]
MIASLSVILVCQLIGEVLVRGLHLPLPGPVIGMALLFALLILRDQYAGLARGPLSENAVEGTAKGMLAHLSLLFVPAGVGVVQNLDLLAQRGVAIAFVLAASVVVTLLVTAGTFLVINRLLARRRQSS